MPTNRNRSLVEHLATNVMGWHEGSNLPTAWYKENWNDSGLSVFVHWKENWNPLEPSTATWAVWEKAREMGIYVTLHGSPTEGWKAYYPVKPKGSLVLDFASANSGPRAICEAIARATGWEELKDEK